MDECKPLEGGMTNIGQRVQHKMFLQQCARHNAVGRCRLTL